ncbi:MAG: PilZ domain-containing protein [Myxococcales bacterium]|nr:PilZ domain-containing protein [Myxococcales bacterium]
MNDSPRRSQRFPTSQKLRVRCENWNEFVELYATDVSQGGLFVATDSPPSVMSLVEVVLRLPEGHEIPLQARVVHVLDAEHAALEGRKPGVGLELLALDEARKEQMHQLVEYARWDGSSVSPTASYASRIFEVSGSMRPAELVKSLPPPPMEPPAKASVPAPASVRPRGASAPPRAEAGAGGQRRRKRSSSDSSMEAAEPGVRRSRRPEGGTSSEPPRQAVDPALVKDAKRHFAHRRYTDAIKAFEEILELDSKHVEASKWLNMSLARIKLTKGDEAAAAAAYRQALAFDENDLEARKFVREYSRKKRIASLPFGRFFVKDEKR